MQVIKVRDADGNQVSYYSCSVASQLISANQWQVPVDGIHQGTLLTQYRNTGYVHGTKLGRDVYFNEKDLTNMGYQVDTDKYHIPEEVVVELPRGKNDN